MFPTSMKKAISVVPKARLAQPEVLAAQTLEVSEVDACEKSGLGVLEGSSQVQLP